MRVKRQHEERKNLHQDAAEAVDSAVPDGGLDFSGDDLLLDGGFGY
jgi:hypothetical protein